MPTPHPSLLDEVVNTAKGIARSLGFLHDEPQQQSAANKATAMSAARGMQFLADHGRQVAATTNAAIDEATK